MYSGTEFETEAREGREMQRYDADNVRQVAGCIPIDPTRKCVLLVMSSKRYGAWVIPKGGWESDEKIEECAVRETYEEAGVHGEITGQVGDDAFLDYDKYGNLKSRIWFYEMNVSKQLDDWPEGDWRERRWFTFDEAMSPETRLKPYMRSALSLSSIATPQPQTL